MDHVGTRKVVFGMGMFDTYVARPPLKCPRCAAPLDDFQGKDGPRALLVWEQGTAAPVAQNVNDCKLPAEELTTFRLPPRFEIYTECRGCKLWVNVTGFCEDNVWSHSTFGKHIHAVAIPATPVDKDWRQCTRCIEAWKEDVSLKLAGCPHCGALTNLVPGHAG